MAVENKGTDPEPRLPAPATGPDGAPESLFSNLLAELQTGEGLALAAGGTPGLVVCTAALESITHVRKEIESMWGSPDLDLYIFSLFADSRDGARKGLPLEVADELAFLAEINKTIRALDAAFQLQISLPEAYRLINEGDQSRVKMFQKTIAQQSNPVFFSRRREEAAEGFLARLWRSLVLLREGKFRPYLIIAASGAALWWLWSSGLIYAFLS